MSEKQARELLNALTVEEQRELYNFIIAIKALRK